MKFRYILPCVYLVFVAQTSFAPSLAETTRRPESCPSGRIEASSETCCGSECTFNGSVTGWFAEIEPIVTWTVSPGKITSGQNTWSIKVDGSETCKEPITVTLKVTGDGLPKICEVKETYVTKPCQCSSPMPCKLRATRHQPLSGTINRGLWSQRQRR